MHETLETHTRSPGDAGPPGVAGVVGLGSFGRQMARRLVGAGYQVVGYDILPAAVEVAARDGVAPAESPAALARQAAIVVLSLPSSNEVAEACFGRDGLGAAAAAGTLVIDTTSGDPARTPQIAASLAERGIDYVDAGVSGTGGAEAAANGTLTIMVGASPEAFERAKSVLKHFGSRVVRIGPTGSGHVAKTLNNLLLGVSMFATAEAVATGIKAGLDPVALVDVLQASTGRNFCTEQRFPRFVLKGDFSHRSSGRIALLEKDVAQAVALGARLGVPMCISANVHQLLRVVVSEVGPDVPSIHAIRRYETWAGIRFSEASNATDEGGETALRPESSA